MRLALLHGFTQTHHHWHRCGATLAASTAASLALPDLPGHGLSGADRTPLDELATSLPAIIGPATWIGYSMGGRVALAAATHRPPQLERLVVIGATAGLADPSERATRRAEDEARADRIEQIGVAAFVDEWLAAPMFAGHSWPAADVAARRRNNADGLASSLRLSGTGAQRSYWDDLGRIGVPTLVLAGEHDTKFCEIGRRLAAAIPGAEWAVIPGAGHAAHAEQPDATVALISDWLRATAQ